MLVIKKEQKILCEIEWPLGGVEGGPPSPHPHPLWVPDFLSAFLGGAQML